VLDKFLSGVVGERTASESGAKAKRIARESQAIDHVA